MWRDVNVGPLSVSGDLNAIRDGRCSGMSPARSAVLRNMLISQVSEIVSVVHIVPNPLIRQLDRLKGEDGSVDYDKVERLIKQLNEFGPYYKGILETIIANLK